MLIFPSCKGFHNCPNSKRICFLCPGGFPGLLFLGKIAKNDPDGPLSLFQSCVNPFLRPVPGARSTFSDLLPCHLSFIVSNQ